MHKSREQEGRQRLYNDMVRDYGKLSQDQLQLLDESITVDGENFVIAPPPGAVATLSDDGKTVVYKRDAVSLEMMAVPE